MADPFVAACRQAGAGAKAMEQLQAAEAAARRAHAGVWEYGDPGEDSDNEAPEFGAPRPRR